MHRKVTFETLHVLAAQENLQRLSAAEHVVVFLRKYVFHKSSQVSKFILAAWCAYTVWSRMWSETPNVRIRVKYFCHKVMLAVHSVTWQDVKVRFSIFTYSFF